MQRIKEIEYLRGFAILGVILVHVSSFYVLMSSINLLNQTLQLLNIIAHYAVPLFIFISGFVLYNKYSKKIKLKEFYFKRFKYTLPPYLIWSIIFVAITGFTNVLYKIISFSGYFHLWFFAILFQFYLLFPFLKNIYKKYPRQVLWSSLWIQILWNVFSTFEGFWMPRIFLAKIFYFILGMYAVDNFKKIKKIKLWIPSLILVASLFILQMWWADFGEIRLMILEPFYVSSIILIGSKIFVGRLFENSGKTSYGIYLIHALFITLISKYLIANGIGIYDWYFYPILFLTVLVVSYIATLLIKKLPFSEYLIGPN